MKKRKKKSNFQIEASSFRDPSGYLFYEKGTLYRQVNKVYKSDYLLLKSSGLYDQLTREKLLVRHDEVNCRGSLETNAFKVIKPELIDFISYPYEWSFSELKDAALTTLRINQIALEHGMSLKDSSVYNIQFLRGKPIMIDTFSFEKYQENKPWVAYRQFCQHFLAPLALMAFTDIRLKNLLRVYIDGIPLDLAAKLLPKITYINLGIFTHIKLHARFQQKYAGNTQTSKTIGKNMNRAGMLGLIDNLMSIIENMTWKYASDDSEWGDYYNKTNYTNKAFDHKKNVISSWIKKIQPKNVWDLGANDGTFSRIASNMNISTVAFDIDQIAVEKNYLKTKKNKEQMILPLVIDLANPSPAIGWAHQERKSLIDRGPVDVVFALAFIHHLCISNNVPFANLVTFFASITKHLVIEFIPKSDSQLQKLLATRVDIYSQYSLDNFIEAFSKHFSLIQKIKISESDRVLLLFTKK